MAYILHGNSSSQMLYNDDEYDGEIKLAKIHPIFKLGSPVSTYYLESDDNDKYDIHNKDDDDEHDYEDQNGYKSVYF